MDPFRRRAAAYKRQQDDKEDKQTKQKKSAAKEESGGPEARASSEQPDVSGAAERFRTELSAVQELLHARRRQNAEGASSGSASGASGGSDASPGDGSSADREGGGNGGDAGSNPRARKAARFLLLLGREEAANVLKQLDEAEIEEVVGEISRIKSVGRDEAEELLAEFRGFIKTAAETRRGGPETAKRMLAEAFGSERAHELYEQAERKHGGPLDFLNDLEDSQLGTLLEAESVAVQALVLVMIERRKAAALLARLPAEGKPRLVARMARMQKIDPAVLERIGEALREKARSVGRSIDEEVQGKAALSQILRSMNSSDGRDLLEEIEQSDPELARQMRDELFTVDTVLDIEDRGLQEVLSQLSDHEIALILKGKEERFRTKIVQNVSENRRRGISETYSHLGAVSRKEADRASNDFLSHLRELEEQGKLIVRSDDDEYI